MRYYRRMLKIEYIIYTYDNERKNAEKDNVQEKFGRRRVELITLQLKKFKGEIPLLRMMEGKNHKK